MSSDNLHQLDYANSYRKGALATPPQPRGTVLELLLAIGAMLGWSVVAIFVIGMIVGAMGGLGGPVLTVPGIIVAVVLIPMIASARRMVRRRRGLAVLGYVRQAVRLNLPIPRTLLAAAAGENGLLAFRLHELTQALLTGAPVSASIAGTVPEVSPRAIGLILLGEQAGRLGDALDGVLGEAVKKSRDNTAASDSIVFWYVPAALAIAFGVISTITIYVVPKFDQILRDFKAPPPPIFAAVASTGDWLLPFLPVIALVILFAVALRLREAITGRPPLRAFGRMADYVFWWVPVAHGLVRDRALGDICVSMADAVESGYPMDQVLVRVSQLDVNAVMQRRVVRWAAGITHGLLPSDAARAARMPPLLVGLLATARANPAEMLRFAGRFYQTRSEQRRAILRSMYLPVCTIFTGAIVLFVALSIFEPMQTLLRISGPQWFGP